ncbi:MAG: glycosyltransferase, partial [Candidatus Nanopelagicales bacterium]
MHQAQALREGGIKVGVISAGVISPRFVLRGYPYTKQECVRGIQVLRSYERKYMLQRNAHPSRVVETQVRLGLDLYRRYERRFGRPDVVHAHDVLRSASIARALQDSEGIPYGVTEHSSVFAMGGLSGEAVGVARECLRGAAFITAVSQALGRWVQRALDHRGLRVGVLPNVLDPDFQCHQPLLRARADSATFLSVGSLDCNKDHGTLLIAFAAQFGGGSSRLRIAGTGPL